MSILIKGMEMPKRCADCYISEHDCCPLLHEWCSETGRNENCPLVEVPKHGRLIDADKLAELCNIMADKCDGIGKSIWEQFRATVEWSPTIIEAEE